jgi:uncharacterized membrane protein
MQDTAIYGTAKQASAEGVLAWVERAATGVELLAVAIIVVVIAIATILYVAQIVAGRADRTTYDNFRHRVGRALLLGLEILVAADIIRTVVLEPTLSNVLVLGLLVVIRTFLSWSLVLEIEERWPWQPPRRESREQLAPDAESSP